MRSPDDIDAEARSKPAFSNGTEAEAWMDNWCDRCLHDAPYRNMGKGTGCPILEVALHGEKTPAEWFEQPWGERGPRLGDRYHCIEYKAPANAEARRGLGRNRAAWMACSNAPPTAPGSTCTPPRGWGSMPKPQPMWTLLLDSNNAMYRFTSKAEAFRKLCEQRVHVLRPIKLHVDPSTLDRPRKRAKP